MGARHIALLGGSFNPPHVGHLMAALYVRATLEVDEVWLVPAFNHPFGKPLAPFPDRLALCEAMAADHQAWLKVSRAEEAVGGEGRTVELLEWLIPRTPGVSFRWIIGSDILADLPKWKAWDRVQALATVTVLHRAGYSSPDALGPPMAQVSSSEIRLAFERGEPPAELVPREVLALIKARGLYGAGRAAGATSTPE
jgi:nicotinate-nucleotide adenylyltransferase